MSAQPTAMMLTPQGELNVLEAVLQLIPLHETDVFAHYYRALKLIWPELHTRDLRAFRLLAVEVFLDAAEIKGFAVTSAKLTQI